MFKHKSPLVSIIDYGMGNLFSVKQACIHVGLQAEVSSERAEILNADATILPGVGAFGDAMLNLAKLDLIDAIYKFVKSGKPFMGICLGMQLLFSESEEFGIHKGLDIIAGRVVKFRSAKEEKIKVPQVGWNRIERSAYGKTWEGTILDGIQEGSFMYFVHSYYCQPVKSDVVLSSSKYSGIGYCSSIVSDNIFACQFHPEKSSKRGIGIYKNFKKLICWEA